MKLRALLALSLLPLSCACAAEPPSVAEPALDARAALFAAVEAGDEAAVKRMIESGAELNFRNAAGYTPFWTAVKLRHFAIAGMLLEGGAVYEMGTQYRDLPKDEEGEKAFDRAILGVYARRYMTELLTDGFKGRQQQYHDVYTEEEVEEYRVCYPDGFAAYTQEAQEWAAEMQQLRDACRAWQLAMSDFAHAYWQLEISPKNIVNTFDRSGDVSKAVNCAIQEDARAFASTACWYQAAAGSPAQVTVEWRVHGFGCEIPDNAPAAIRAYGEYLRTHNLYKHEEIETVRAAHETWKKLQDEEIAAIRSEILHDTELIRLFDDAVRAWNAYYECMLALHRSRCRCTSGSEYNKQGIYMISHFAKCLDAIRDMPLVLKSTQETGGE